MIATNSGGTGLFCECGRYRCYENTSTGSSMRCTRCGRYRENYYDREQPQVRSRRRVTTTDPRDKQLWRVLEAKQKRIDKTAAATAAAVLQLGRASMRRPCPPHRFVRHPRIKRASAKG